MPALSMAACTSIEKSARHRIIGIDAAFELGGILMLSYHWRFWLGLKPPDRWRHFDANSCCAPLSLIFFMTSGLQFSSLTSGISCVVVSLEHALAKANRMAKRKGLIGFIYSLLTNNEPDWSDSRPCAVSRPRPLPELRDPLPPAS